MAHPVQSLVDRTPARDQQGEIAQILDGEAPVQLFDRPGEPAFDLGGDRATAPGSGRIARFVLMVTGSPSHTNASGICSPT